jgi:hypothetical protein
MVPTNLVSDITGAAKLDEMSDQELIAAFERLIRNKLFDPEATAEYFVTEIERRLGDRTLSHRQRYLIIRDRLSKLSHTTVSTEMANSDPAYARFNELERKALALQQEIRSILNSIEGYASDSIPYRRGLKKAERRVKQFGVLEEQMKGIETSLEHAHSRLKGYLDTAEPLWKGVKGADWLIVKLKFSLAFVEFQTFAVRLIYLIIMLILAVIVDRYLPLAERVFDLAGPSQRHPLALFLLFLVQALLFEPVFVWAKKRISWNIVRRMTRTAHKLLVKVDDYEQRLSRSEGELSGLEREI